MRISDWSSDVCSSDLLDSPMAINATDLLHAHSDDHRLTHDECTSISKIATYTRDVESSKAITASVFPKVVISASGMATGGRVLHHLKSFATEIGRASGRERGCQ